MTMFKTFIYCRQEHHCSTLQRVATAASSLCQATSVKDGRCPSACNTVDSRKFPKIVNAKASCRQPCCAVPPISSCPAAPHRTCDSSASAPCMTSAQADRAHQCVAPAATSAAGCCTMTCSARGIDLHTQWPACTCARCGSGAYSEHVHPREHENLRGGKVSAHSSVAFGGMTPPAPLAP